MSFKGLISLYINEAAAYENIADIEKLSDQNKDLSQLPLQPLYLLLKGASFELVADALGKMSTEQRVALQDLDLWAKDDVNPDEYEFWVQAYALVQDLEIKREFYMGGQFTLYLKSRVNIMTFDYDDPQYPDHDYYFLSEDGLLLFEYGEDYPYGDLLRFHIRELYSLLGVEGAYSFLFKFIADSFLSFQEEEYRWKKNRLEDLGFVDYFDALQFLYPFASLKECERYVKEYWKKEAQSGEVEAVNMAQSLHAKTLSAFHQDVDPIEAEYNVIEDSKRADFLRFNFLKVINANIEVKQALKAGAVSMNYAGQETRNYLLLGLQYVKRYQPQDKHVLYQFDFSGLYRIGRTLIELPLKRWKKALGAEIEEVLSFGGSRWENFFQASYLSPPRYFVKLEEKPSEILSWDIYDSWKKDLDLFSQLCPFLHSLQKQFKEIKNIGTIQDSYYLNYGISDIDFECILLSSFFNFTIDENHDAGKLGLSLDDLKKILEIYFDLDGDSKVKASSIKTFESKVEAFQKAYGLEAVEMFKEYLFAVMEENLSGYDFSLMNEEEFSHVGGALILR